jgi:hypothetical protein
MRGCSVYCDEVGGLRQAGSTHANARSLAVGVKVPLVWAKVKLFEGGSVNFRLKTGQKLSEAVASPQIARTGQGSRLFLFNRLICLLVLGGLYLVGLCGGEGSSAWVFQLVA